MTDLTRRHRRALFSVAILGAAILASCGSSAGEEISSAGDPAAATSTTAAPVDGVYDGFRVVGEESVGLNGIDNDGRPPLEFLLLASADDPSLTEDELVDRYTASLSDDGWEVFPFDSEEDWWTAEGNDGVAFVRVGPSSRFHELARIDEGYSRTVFRELAAENPEPLIVVSIDPVG